MQRRAISWLLAGLLLLPGCFGGGGGDKNVNKGKDMPVPDTQKK